MFELLGLLWEGFWELFDRPKPVKDYSNDPEANARFQRLIERNPRFSDPVYKKNLQKLIERNRSFEENR
jgi:hypothetical protein